ncbi:MAG: hypothetical protein CBE43_02975 [Rhodopirellula sp. TMED283]|nr:MAG: hypothetical protein CBE43_02975 [Rhodopirellula sp. TMED283]
MGIVSRAAAQQPAPAGQQVAKLSYAGQLQPITKSGFQAVARSAAHPEQKNHDLSWRKSTAIESAPQATSLQLRRISPAAQKQSGIQQVSGELTSTPTSRNSFSQASSSRRGQASAGLQLAKEAPTLHSISRSGNPASVQGESSSGSKSGITRATWNERRARNTNSAPNYFVDPFNESQDSKPATSLSLPNTTSMTVIQEDSPNRLPSHLGNRSAESMPLELRPANGLRSNIAQLELPSADPPAPTTPTASAPQVVKPPTEPKPPAIETPAPSESLQLAPTVPRVPLEAPPSLPRQAAPTLPLPTEPVAPTPSAPPTANPAKTKSGPSLGEIMKERSPSDQDKQKNNPARAGNPSLRDEIAPPPPTFSEQLRNADQIDKERLNSGKSSGRGFGVSGDVLEDLPFSCEDFRSRIASQTIDQVSLDISPPYRPDEMDEKRYQSLKEEFDEKQAIRTWHDRNGNAIVTGRLNDLAYEKAVIETNDGSNDALPINQLSEGDIAYIAENWGLPKECLIEQVAYTPRQWTPSTMTWKASNLCHHPLYFEDVNLERYGHTRGPILEPVVQSAHFFANIAVLPYKMGVHCPSECQYALGYYRPGNCSPWIKPPVPISVRGAITQAATMTGMFWLIP